MFSILEAATPEVPVGGFNPAMLIMLVGMLALMFFMQSRAKKQAKAREAFRDTLQPGQRVMTQGGLVGTIVAINEAADTVILDSAGSRCEYMRAGIAKTLEDAPIGAYAVPATEVPVGTTLTPVAEPKYGANPVTPAPTGFLANVMGNLAGAAPEPVADDDLAELDAIAQAYHQSGGVENATVNPTVVVIEEE